MTITASTPADPGADFEQAARQAIRLLAPARLHLVASQPRPPSQGRSLYGRRRGGSRDQHRRPQPR
ncbi:hypothetical protein [Streptomyces nodosus]|uniref:hypothetical protein n=1 Tax=Streptomyces nodosus TaxID=40318 RepID=UPI003823F5E7